MKVFVGFFIATLSGISVAAQEAPQPPRTVTAPAPAAKVFAEFGVGSVSAMKNAPFSAEEVNESVQTLADGNRIVHNSSSKMYRNSEGRMRRDSRGGLGGVLGSPYMIAPNISIVDPIFRQKYELDAALKTARVYDLKAGQDLVATTASKVAAAKASEELITKLRAEGKLTATTDQKSTEELIAKLRAEGKLDSVRVTTGGQTTGDKTVTVTGVNSEAYTSGLSLGNKYKSDVKTEDLGTRDFEGVTAEGTRKVTTIPAGAIGNERPIEVVYERWYSKELGVVVYSKTVDPRMGEQTYRLTNIVRAEPDPSLFNVPTEYRKIGEQGAAYRVTPTRSVTPKPAAAKVTAQAGKP